ncbi:MAG: hypothetical protein EXX96DRAFT_589667 [Benjaminiella poitrasii]|nr:MAG: hypothetical protein EXX96DRAFT_589667 [Benjaminiella poitrasii]
MVIKVLDNTTVRNLHSGQVIVDVESIVKELLENSIDAHATSIELVLINNGVESIQIKDDGDGIDEKDRPYVAKRHHTSKLTTFEDLASTMTFGFRGEALNSICSIADKVVLTTRSKSNVVGRQYEINANGDLSKDKPTNSFASTGTMITVYKPFYRLPVRRQLATKNAVQNMKRIQQELLMKYALAYPKIRFSFYSVPTQLQVWIKPVTRSIEDTITLFYGSQLSQMVERHIETDPADSNLTIDMIIPKSNSDPSVVLKEDCVFVYANQRPINYTKSELKNVIALIRDRYRQMIGLDANVTKRKNPFIYLDIQIVPNEYDVNIEPNKTTILFHDKQCIFNLVEKIINQVYNTTNQFFFSRNTTNVNTNLIEEKEEVTFELDEQQQQHNISSPVTTMKDSSNEWSFSMMSDHSEEEEEEEEQDELVLEHEQDNNPFTSISKWQIDDVHPTPTLPNITTTNTTPIIQQRPHQEQPNHHDIFTEQSTTTTNHIDPQQTLLFIPQKRKQTLDTLLQQQQQQKQQRVLSSFLKPTTTSTTTTLNQTKTIPCSFEQIQATYEQRHVWLRRTHRVRLEDYLLSNNDHVQPKSLLALLPLKKHGLWFYSRGEEGHVAELGVAQVESMQIHAIFERLFKTHPLLCKKNLERPVQIEFKDENPLGGVLLSLKSKEVWIQDDLHGQQEITYSQVTDDVVVWNGLRARWRKDHVRGILVVQLTAIHDLGGTCCYGPDDFREILQSVMHSSSGEDLVRPSKVKEYLWQLAVASEPSLHDDDICNEHVLIQGILGQLIWQKKALDDDEETDWQLGYSPYLPHRLLACKLISK